MTNKDRIIQIIRKNYGSELSEEQVKLIWLKILKLTKLIYKSDKSDEKYQGITN
jgi:hypothetical protein